MQIASQEIIIHYDVEGARAELSPIVALETSIVAHGLPWPLNLEVAKEIETKVRGAGAMPAATAILQGVPQIGLEPEQMERLARAGKDCAKASAADMAVAIARQKDAATTVSATVVLAAHAELKVVATGGIGGVHRGDSGDTSCDLETLAKHKVCVVSSGAKAVLDLPRTLEALESLGVLVVGYQTTEFPAFYCRSSGLALPHSVESPAELAAMLLAHWDLNGSGVLVVNPIPEADALDAKLVEGAVKTALDQAAAKGVRGKALTPFLLAEVDKATGGAAVKANRALAVANARLAAEIAEAVR